ncbi:MAG: LysR family transcriptional regulator [Myxococcota bacterium]
MDLYQLRTFVAVAREGSITRAAEVVHLSQPAVSAHIKAVEDALGLTLFERTPRGMSLTPEGERLLARAEQTLAAHQALMGEASRLKGHLTGKLRVGVGGKPNHEAIGRLLTQLAERHPEVEASLQHGTSREILAGLRSGGLDAGFYNEAGAPDADLTTLEVATFRIDVVASPGLVARPLDWAALAERPWVFPVASACCGRAAENLFQRHQVRPRKIIDVDREDVTRTLIAGGLGVGLLHADTARDAEAKGEVELVCEAQARVRVLFAHLASRAQDPLLTAARALLQS